MPKIQLKNQLHTCEFALAKQQTSFVEYKKYANEIRAKFERPF